MIPSTRYALAFAVNVALPALAYRLALPHYGLLDALIASGLPVLAWMAIDLLRFRHFDALSALVLASIVLSLAVLMSEPGRGLREARDPLVSGVIGVFFLLSLASRRPLVFYLARSTLARERSGQEIEFDRTWPVRPDLVRSVRLMTAVWGIGLVGENVVRLWITSDMSGHDADRLSTLIRYGVYTGLTVWTILYRRLYIKRRQS
ncbi:VC0807 family protein [Paraburkholderia ferrariae]|uniref:VC0807 family protein n=1 Tax=Paraburkholderia ferrariae TaxID=386056 RepID=UPI00048A0534|nr:VC0807 family protein [Paraburkholderia ferrariae]